MARIKIVHILDENWLMVETAKDIGDPGEPIREQGRVRFEDFCEVYGMSPHSNIDWLVGETRNGFPRNKIAPITEPEQARDEPVGYGETW
ncbi:hypothetical protein [Paraburkholderia sp.]|uniref:hypothetical protein n=1 Tax=Paraburkholderia sp. TaxID=1926495 RepID=UPI0039E62BE4